MGGAGGQASPWTHKNGKEGKKNEKGKKGRKKGKKRKGKGEEKTRAVLEPQVSPACILVNKVRTTDTLNVV